MGKLSRQDPAIVELLKTLVLRPPHINGLGNRLSVAVALNPARGLSNLQPPTFLSVEGCAALDCSPSTETRLKNQKPQCKKFPSFLTQEWTYCLFINPVHRGKDMPSHTTSTWKDYRLIRSGAETDPCPMLHLLATDIPHSCKRQQPYAIPRLFRPPTYFQAVCLLQGRWCAAGEPVAEDPSISANGQRAAPTRTDDRRRTRNYRCRGS